MSLIPTWIVGLLLAIGALLSVGCIAGYHWRDTEVANLSGAAADLQRDVDQCDSTLRGVRATLQKTIDQARRREAANRSVLSAHAARIAELNDAEKQRQLEITNRVKNDENCIALRNLPVCGAVADELWVRP